MKRTFRPLIALACGAIVAVVAAAPAMSATTGAFAADAAGKGLVLEIFSPGSDTPALGVHIGTTTGKLKSLPTAAGTASGVEEVDTATTSAPPDAEDEVGPVNLTIGDLNTIGVALR